MTVVYYTSTFFLDLSLDIINVLKKKVDLHIFIEVTSSSKNSTVAEIHDFPTGKLLATPEEVLSDKSLKVLAPFFEGAISMHFIIHEHRTGFSWSTLQASLAVWKYIKPFKPEIIHFEGYTLRTIGMLPFLFSVKKVFLVIHDPVPHTGESSWKISMPNFLFFKLPFKKYFIFYSDFARKLFTNNYRSVGGEKLLVKMRPYSYFKKSPEKSTDEKEHILFFGRISPYKGIDVLLKAMPAVFEEFANEKLVIAGKSTNSYILNDDLPEKYKDNVQIINRYITNDELIDLISRAKFVVCPYLDATQSGVLMTAFALDTPAITTNVGSFPEFIDNNFNGLLVSPACPALLSEKIALALKHNYYKQLQHNVVLSNTLSSWEDSLKAVLTEYTSL
ncbi:glycosyltransferase family 4 protein [Mucilaginibacter terrae]|uniref:glycosyltransferase family 4 protein n=1 Tax=Mucilaginibacter terrae TaxID=1955052 RepID=UPI00362F452D